MKSFNTVDEFILNATNGKETLLMLRDIINKTELVETIKWGAPTYTINGKNVVGLGAFKSYVGLWFFQGVLLKDEEKVLINARKDKTKAMRQWRFEPDEKLNESLISKYLKEAIENEKHNRKIKADRTKPVIIPEELEQALEENTALKNNFYSFSKGKQREFAEYISDAKREETRKARIKKIIPLILQNIGLNDKYRK